MSVSTQPGQIALTRTPSRRELGGERAHEPEEPGLRGAVARVAGDRDPGQDRRDHDDVARVRPGRQVPQRRAHAVVRAVEVRPDEVVEAVAALVVLAVRPADPARRRRARGSGRGAPRHARTRRSTASRSRMSHGLDVTCARRRAPPSPSSSPSLEAEQSRRPRRHAASRRAIARPIPVPAPVTTTCLPLIRSPLVRNLRRFRRRDPLARDALGKA